MAAATGQTVTERIAKLQADNNENIQFQQEMARISREGEQELTAINVKRTYESGKNASVSKNAETLAKIGKMGSDASNKLWG